MPVLNLNRFNVARCGFPKPQLSALPNRLELPSLRNGGAESAAAKQPNNFRHFTRGRYALGEAYRLAGVGQDGALLAPAYHCVTMLDPALPLNADIQLYPLQADLSPDLVKLDELLAAYGRPVKALLATHFFGFAQDFSDLKQWCDEHRIALIEDCSHALFTERFQAAGIGIFGRFVAASPYKFFACEDGGLLYSPEDHLLDSVKTKPAGLTQELRGIKRSIEKFRSATVPPSATTSLDRQLEILSASPLITAEEYISQYSQPSSLHTAGEIKTASLRSSRFIVGHSSIEENIRYRQNNYQRWVKAVETLPNCHAPFPDLPEGCAPYMFPLHIDHPTPHFYWLKHLGIPVWRWDEMAISDCPIAQDYRLHLLQLPCHQSLTESQMDWLISAVTKTLRHPAQGAY